MENEEKRKYESETVNQAEEHEKVENKEMDFYTIPNAKMDKNWKEYLQNHMFNYRSACVKGEMFDKINSYQGKLYCFPVKEGCSIKAGDIALLNQYCEAFAINDSSVPEEEWTMSEIVGTVDFTTKLHNGQDIIFIREMAVLEFVNSSDSDLALTQGSVCNACYLEDSHTVCNDTLKPFAGQIMSIEGDIVKVFVSLEINDHKRWVWDQELLPDDLYENMRARCQIW